MSATPHELLVAAQLIQKTHSDEAGRRALVSRAYYAAYHAAYSFHAKLPTPGSVGTAAGRHEQLIAQLSNPTVKPADAKHFASKKVGFILRDLVRARVKADYSMGALLSESEAEGALFKAEDIFKVCYPSM